MIIDIYRPKSRPTPPPKAEPAATTEKPVDEHAESCATTQAFAKVGTRCDCGGILDTF